MGMTLIYAHDFVLYVFGVSELLGRFLGRMKVERKAGKSGIYMY